MPTLRRLAHALAAALVLAGPAAAQTTWKETPRAPMPDRLAEQVGRDVAADGLLDGVDVGKHVIVSDTADLNGDGRPEYTVATNGPFCSMNGVCHQWVYHEEPGGAFRRVYAWIGRGVAARETRTNGWLDVGAGVPHGMGEREYADYAFDGTRYVRVKTVVEIVGGDDGDPYDAFTVLSPVRDSGDPAPRTVTLSAIPVGVPGVILSADYTACTREAATSGAVCGRPRLLLRVADGTGAPWHSGACFALRGGIRVDGGRPLEELGTVCPEGAATGGGTVVLRPTPAQWKAIRGQVGMEIAAGTFTLAFDGDNPDPLHGLRYFLDAVYDLNGIKTDGL